jgi:hypothetical protein
MLSSLAMERENFEYMINKERISTKLFYSNVSTNQGSQVTRRRGKQQEQKEETIQKHPS